MGGVENKGRGINGIAVFVGFLLFDLGAVPSVPRSLSEVFIRGKK